MTGFEILTLVILAVFIVAEAAHQYSKHKGSMKNFIQDTKDIEVRTEQVVNELYNKDLRPIVAKKAPKEKKQTEASKTEFPIDKPKKKRKYYPRKPKANN